MQEGIWVSKLVSATMGEVIVSVRLDMTLDPEVMYNKLDKEADELRKRMDKILLKLDSFNEKTPQKIIDSTIKELTEVCNLQSINITESRQWSEAWRLKILDGK